MSTLTSSVPITGFAMLAESFELLIAVGATEHFLVVALAMNALFISSCVTNGQHTYIHALCCNSLDW